MKNNNDVEVCWQPEQANHFKSAVGYYELGMLEESETELSKIDPCVATNSVSVLALRLAISYSRSDWIKMKIIARKVFLLDPSNPQWPFCDGYATAKTDSIIDAEDQNRD